MSCKDFINIRIFHTKQEISKNLQLNLFRQKKHQGKTNAGI